MYEQIFMIIRCNKISDAGLEYFENVICCHLTKIEYIHVNFSFCTKITSDGVDIIRSGNRLNLLRLKYLYVNFEW